MRRCYGSARQCGRCRSSIITRRKRAASPPVARKQASIKQYREADGRFFFKLMDSEGRLLLQGVGHPSARDVGQLIARLRASAGQGLKHVENVGLYLGDERLGEIASGVAEEDLAAALAGMAEDAQ